MLTGGEIDAVVEQVVALLQPQKVILFGSYAKGTAKATSDLDVMVIKETQLPMHRRAESVGPALHDLLVPIDVLVYTPEEVAEYGRDPFSFISTVVRSGSVAFEA